MLWIYVGVGLLGFVTLFVIVLLFRCLFQKGAPPSNNYSTDESGFGSPQGSPMRHPSAVMNTRYSMDNVAYDPASLRPVIHLESFHSPGHGNMNMPAQSTDMRSPMPAIRTEEALGMVGDTAMHDPEAPETFC